MLNHAPTSPTTSAQQMAEALIERHVQLLDAALQFHLTDTHARVLSRAEPVEPATTTNIHVRGLAEPKSSAYQPD